MTLKIPLPSAASITLGMGKHSTGWKLGQITQGRVANSNHANPSINIAGTNYQLTSSLQFAPGESLLLKVSEVSPQLQFSVISRTANNVGNNDVAAVVLPDKFLQNSPTSNSNINTSLTNLLQLLHSNSSQIPPATALLIDAMKNRMLRENGLIHPKLIERSLLSNSILMNNSSESRALDGGLLNLLEQIVNSLESQKNSIKQVPTGAKYQQALAMMLYLSSDMDFLEKFTREVGEQYSKLLNLRNNTQEDMQQYAYRLLAELPVLYKNQAKSVSMRFFEKSSKERTGTKEIDCGVEFEFDFNNGRIYTKVHILASAVYISLGCERHETAEYFSASKHSLAEKLLNYGLNLKTFQVAVQGDYLPLSTDSVDMEFQQIEDQQEERFSRFVEKEDEEIRNRLHNAYLEDKVPDLEEYTLHIENQNVAVTSKIPEQLYCAMACFFAQLLEAKN